MSDDRNFDPRFDPAFQRGYDGVVDARPRATVTESVAPAPAATPAAAVAPATASDPVAQAAVVQGAVPQGSTAQASTVVEEIPGEDPLPRRVNPFLIVLALISIVLIGAGFYLVARIPDLYANSQDSVNFDFVTLQVLIAAAPLSIALGLATAIGLLFVLALGWGKR